MTGRSWEMMRYPALAAILLLAAVPATAATADVAVVHEAPSAISTTAEAANFLEDALRKAKGGNAESKEHPTLSQLGDLARVDYTLTLEDGSLVATSRTAVASASGSKRSEVFSVDRADGPEEIVVGQSALAPGIAETAAGMKVGEKKHATLPPERAFGKVDPAALVAFPREKTVPRSVQVSAEQYLKMFGSLPVAGKKVPLSPYFGGTVTEVGETQVTVTAEVDGQKTFDESFGTVTVAVKDNMVSMTLSPRMGASFQAQSHTGKITAVGDTSFTVDFNHPLAGKSLVLDLELLSLVKASSFQGKNVEWLTEYDQALSRAKVEGKPVVLALYADWCSFCKKLFSETMEDPRVKNLRDGFVWVKVNSDKDKKYYDQYAQQAFPLTVLLKPDGTVAEKMDGFRDGAAFSRELRKAVEQ